MTDSNNDKIQKRLKVVKFQTTFMAHCGKTEPSSLVCNLTVIVVGILTALKVKTLWVLLYHFMNLDCSF
jgi:hypothetical protein